MADKYICLSGGNYQLLNDEPIFIKSSIGGTKCYNLKEVLLEKNKEYDIIHIDKFLYKNDTYEYKLIITKENNNDNGFYITRHDLNKYFCKAMIKEKN